MHNNNEMAPWQHADLPEPPRPRGLSWIGVCGPGVIVLGVSIGSGEFLLGPATFVSRSSDDQRFLLISMPFPISMSTESMSPAARTRAR